MTQLTLHCGNAEIDAEPMQLIQMTHLSAREMHIDKRLTPLVVSPGVLVIMPKNDNLQVIIGPDTLRVPQGMSLAVAGDMDKALMPEPLPDGQQHPKPTVLLMEVGAVLNRSCTLMEHLDIPRLFDYETTSKLIALYEQIFVTRKAVLLPGASVDVYGPYLQSGIILTLLAAGTSSTKTHFADSDEPQTLRLKTFLLENLSSRLSIPEIAHHMGMSVKTLSRWIRRELDTSPAQYFKELRLQKSLELISHMERGIDEIAEQTGFPNRYYFSKAFKNRFGSAPAQLRKSLNTYSPSDLLSKANDHFRHSQFRRALNACDQGMETTTSADDQEHFSYLRGRCLNALGKRKDAMREWETLKNSKYAHSAGMEQCRLLFTVGKHEEALALFRDLFTDADEDQRQELVRLWMDQVVSIFTERRADLLKNHTSIRGELFPHNMESMRLAADALRVLEENDEALHQCGEIRAACFHALRRAGKLDEAIARYGDANTIEAAVALLGSGRYQEAQAALERCPHTRLHAELLAKTGRADEAIRRYPEHCQLAYFLLGQYQELLDRFPEPAYELSFEKIYALHALGRNDELLTACSTDDPARWINAQLCACPENILRSTLPLTREYHGRARLLITLRALKGGQATQDIAALSEIKDLRSPNLWWADHSGAELILSSAVKGLLRGKKDLHADFDHAIRNFKFKMRQTLWHDAAYLAGVITKTEYFAQPSHEDVSTRFAFLQALAHDIGRKHALAIEVYKPFTESIAPYNSDGLLRERFAQWRLQALAANV